MSELDENVDFAQLREDLDTSGNCSLGLDYVLMETENFVCA